MKITGLAFCAIGILMILTFTFADYFGPDKDGGFGAAQLLGVESGIALILTGSGFMFIKWNREIEIKKSIRLLIDRVIDLPPAFWAVSTFLVLYVAYFITPIFFSKMQIQYFVKYIPDAWATRIGFDIEATVSHIGTWLVNGQSPYSDGVVPYSPLTLVIFAPFLILGYPGYYKFLTLITIACYILTTLLIPVFIGIRKNYALYLLFSIAGLFSYGFQFEMERGQFNMIAFTLCLLGIYIYHHHNDFRFFAYLFFTLSVQLKLYPLIFMVMFIKNWRDWKNNIRRLLGLVVLNFSLFFILGYQLFFEFIKSITGRQLHFQSSRIEDLSIRGFIYALTTDGFGLAPASLFAQFGRSLEIFFLILFGACLVSIIIHAYIHNLTGINMYLLVICTIGALIIPTASFDYKLPILVTPMMLIFCNLPAAPGTYRKIVSVAVTVIMSIAYWSTCYPFTVKPAILSRNFPALFVILISIVTIYILMDGKTEPDIDKLDMRENYS